MPSNTWTQFSIPLSALGVAHLTNCAGFWFYAAGSVTTTFDLDSIQLIYAAPPSLAIAPSQPAHSLFVLQLYGISGQTYRIDTSTNLVSWTSVSTNVLTTASAFLTNAVKANTDRQFWRAVWTQ